MTGWRAFSLHMEMMRGIESGAGFRRKDRNASDESLRLVLGRPIHAPFELRIVGMPWTSALHSVLVLFSACR